MTTVSDHLNFIIFGKLKWSEMDLQLSPLSVVEKQLNDTDKATLREGKPLSERKLVQKDLGYEVDGVIFVTHQIAESYIKACTEMKRAANFLRAAVVVISLATLTVVRSRSPYHPFVLLACSIAGIVFVFFRHSQASVFLEKAWGCIEASASTIQKDRTDFLLGNQKELSSPIFHHLEAEFKVKDQITFWLTQLSQLPRNSPEEKNLYVEHFLLKAPFNSEETQKILKTLSASPSPLVNWYEQVRTFIKEHAGKIKVYEQELFEQLESILSCIDVESKGFQDNLNENVYLHYWDLAIAGALSLHPTVKTVHEQTTLRFALSEKKYALYCEQIQALSAQLTCYLAGQLTLAHPKETLEEAFKVPHWDLQKEWNPKKLFSNGWLAEAQKLIPALGSSKQYQSFLLRVANGVAIQ